MSRSIDHASLLRAAVLVVGGGVAGLAFNAARPTGIALVGFEAPSVCSAAAEAGAPDIEMDPREASALCGRAGVVFADTRSEARFAEGHVADAVHLPCDTTTHKADVAIHRLEHKQTIIVYGDSSDDGRAVAETLRRLGVEGDLRVLRGGFAAWERDGLACASGPCRDCTVSRESAR